jgi:glutamine synthetase
MKIVNKYLSTNYQQFGNRNAKCRVCEVWKVKTGFFERFQNISSNIYLLVALYGYLSRVTNM